MIKIKEIINALRQYELAHGAQKRILDGPSNPSMLISRGELLALIERVEGNESGNDALCLGCPDVTYPKEDDGLAVDINPDNDDMR